MVKLDPVEIRQPLVPVARVLLHDPDFVLDPPNAAKRAGARVDLDLPQVVIVVFERLLANDHIPAARNGGHDEAGGARLGQFEFDGMLVPRIDLADRPEEGAARDAYALRRLG